MLHSINRRMPHRSSLVLTMCLMLVFALAEMQFAESPPKAEVVPLEKEFAGKKSEGKDSAEKEKPDDEREVFSGQVVMLQAALKKRGIKSGEEIKDQVVLVTKSGELWPIVPDWRGRALYQDERLRNRPVDLVCKRTPGVPWLQVLSIYSFDKKGTRQITDYWCDICSIPMYEIKPCDCCQAEIRLRFRDQDLPPEAHLHEPAVQP